MGHGIGRSSWWAFAWLGLLATAVSGRALGSPSLNYTVTDLGSVSVWSYTRDGHFVTSSGMVYDFPRSLWLRDASSEVLPLTRPDIAGSQTWKPYDYVDRAYTNESGSLIAYIEHVSPQYPINVTVMGFVATRGANGEWTRAADFGTYHKNEYGPHIGRPPIIQDINNLNQVLVRTGTSYLDADPDPKVKLYDADSNTMVDLTKMLADRWTALGGLALDDQGRILLGGRAIDDADQYPYRGRLLLLTPDGVPIIDPTPVPEPSTIAFIALAAAGYAWRRSRGARRSA